MFGLVCVRKNWNPWTSLKRLSKYYSIYRKCFSYLQYIIIVQYVTYAKYVTYTYGRLQIEKIWKVWTNSQQRAHSGLILKSKLYNWNIILFYFRAIYMNRDTFICRHTYFLSKNTMKNQILVFKVMLSNIIDWALLWNTKTVIDKIIAVIDLKILMYLIWGASIFLEKYN